MEKAIQLRELYERAREAAKGAYAPYSRFHVGAALLTDDGKVFTGVNVENRSFGLTNCAERSALYAAVSSGVRRFSAIAIAAPDADYPVSPCGACRQVLSEFMAPETTVVFGPDFDRGVQTTLGARFPDDARHELAGEAR